MNDTSKSVGQGGQKPVSWINHEERQHCRFDYTAPEVLLSLSVACPEAYEHAFIVGSWVWVQFPEAPAPATRAMLSQMGFHWSSRRKAWQHPCGSPEGVGVGGDPIRRYGMQSARALIHGVAA